MEATVSSVRVAVHLLKAIRVSGHHSRTVKVQVDSLEGKPLLFSPQLNKEDWQGIIATSCVTGKDSLVLTLENHNLHPIALAAGEVIGEMEEVEIISPGEWHTSMGKYVTSSLLVSHMKHVQIFVLQNK